MAPVKQEEQSNTEKLRLELTRERITSELMDEAAPSPPPSANVTLVINHDAHNYVIINKINDVCDLCETFVRLIVDHRADRRVPPPMPLIKVTLTDGASVISLRVL